MTNLVIRQLVSKPGSGIVNSSLEFGVVCTNTAGELSNERFGLINRNAKNHTNRNFWNVETRNVIKFKLTLQFEVEKESLYSFDDIPF